MCTLFAIIDSEKNRNALQHQLLSCCPSLEFSSYTSITQILECPANKGRPQVVFLNPNYCCIKQHNQLYNTSLDLEVILLLSPDDEFPQWGQFRPFNYLLYPIQQNLLCATIHAAVKLIESKKRTNISANNSKIAIPTHDGLDFIQVNDIIRCESLNNCTKVITVAGHKNIISSYNIGQFRKLLEPYGFYTPHKSHLINLHQIAHYKREGIILMTDDPKVGIPVARNKRTEFLRLIPRL